MLGCEYALSLTHRYVRKHTHTHTHTHTHIYIYIYIYIYVNRVWERERERERERKRGGDRQSKKDRKIDTLTPISFLNKKSTFLKSSSIKLIQSKYIVLGIIYF